MQVITLESTVREVVSATLVNLAKMFTDRCKLTLIVRDQGNPDAFTIFSEDEKEKVIEVIQRAIKQKIESEAFKQQKVTPANNV